MRKGFTLIELLVVIAIIGILATMVLASISGARGRARDAKRQQDIAQVKTALEMYKSDNEVYPAKGSFPTTTWTAMATALQSGNYMKNVPNDPLNTGSYVYTYSSTDGSTYTITYKTENNPNRPDCTGTAAPYTCTITPD